MKVTFTLIHGSQVGKLVGVAFEECMDFSVRPRKMTVTIEEETEDD